MVDYASVKDHYVLEALVIGKRVMENPALVVSNALELLIAETNVYRGAIRGKIGYVTKSDLIGRRRHNHISSLRNVGYYIFLEKLEQTTTDVGDIFGKDHSTAISGAKRIKSLYGINSEEVDMLYKKSLETKPLVSVEQPKEKSITHLRDKEEREYALINALVVYRLLENSSGIINTCNVIDFVARAGRVTADSLRSVSDDFRVSYLREIGCAFLLDNAHVPASDASKAFCYESESDALVASARIKSAANRYKLRVDASLERYLLHRLDTK